VTRSPARRPAPRHGDHRPRWLTLLLWRPLAILLAGGACLLTTSASPVRPGSAASSAGSQSDLTRLAAAALHAPVAPLPQIVPAPVAMTAGRGWFMLTRQARIVVPPGSSAAGPVARELAGYLRPATGYPLPVVTGTPAAGDIALVIGSTGIKAGTHGEGYTLEAAPGAVRLTAQTPHGLYDAVQTLRQLFPAWIASPRPRPGPWPVPAVRITDYPRYAYRGVMLDIARHYEPPSAVESLISQAAAYKINVLHLHLSDDQGFRLVIRGFPRLSRLGGRGSVGTDGRVRDPGGFWTQEQYKAVVAYAAAHFVTVVPEVDTPGHNNAIIMSEYADTKNPLLNGHPQDINCGKRNPPGWNYTEDVGYSALCPGSRNTWVIMSAIIDQLSSLSPGPYYDIGGDEVPSTLLSQPAYTSFVSKEAQIVGAHGKTLMGWADIAGPGTRVSPGSVAEYWQPASGSSGGTVTAREAVKKGMKLVMAPADHAYLDQKYVAGSHGDVPPGLGQTWACPGGCDLDKAYNWNPGTLVTGVTDRSIIGVEGAVWTETLANLGTADYMAFPRLLALAEVAWSPSARRSLGSPAYRSFLRRIAVQGSRLMAARVNFYPSAEVRWQAAVTGSALTADSHGRLTGTVATVAAPGFSPGAVTATIAWGDGTTSRGRATGRPPGTASVNSLFAVTGQHSFAHQGLYHGTVTVRVRGRAPVTVRFTVRSP
jgi:hexosaminidase